MTGKIDWLLIFEILAGAAVAIGLLLLAKHFKKKMKNFEVDKKQEKAEEFYSLAGSKELTAEEKASLLDVMDKKL